MATNIFRIKPAHDAARISLRGDMSLSFEDDVTDTFSIGFLTSTDEIFTFNSVRHQFIDTTGNLVNGLVFGGRPGLFMELMFDPLEATWYISANNIISNTGGSSVDTSEKPLAFLAAPLKTPINYNLGRNFRGKLSANAVLANPTGMKPGDRLRVIIEQDITGNRTLTYDTGYGFPAAQAPALSVNGRSVDVLECYLSGDWTLQCDLYKNYSIVTPLAYGNSEFGYTMQAVINKVQSSELNGQTVQVIRDGYRTECNATVGYQVTNPLNIRIKGVRRADGTLPELKLDKTDRAAFGKALVNIEGGTNVVVEDLKITGAVAQDSSNGTGVLINAKVDYVLIKNCHIYANENGVRSAVTKHPRYDLENVFLEANGWASIASYAGQTHSIYAGDTECWRATRTTFYNAVSGHNIKTRGLHTILKQVYSRKSNGSREIDCPDQGLLHATDCVFWKESTGSQNNVVAIGYEMAGGVRYQEYFFINCYFHNDVNPARDVTFLENRAKGSTLNSVPVHFIDCEFGGAALKKTTSMSNLFSGPYTITLTGGPVGPRVPVGSTHMLWPGTKDADRMTNPANIPLTPYENLPPMTVTEPQPPYPTFGPVPDVPTLPPAGLDHPQTPDTEMPVVALGASTTLVQTSGATATLTATASDNIGIARIEFYRNDVLIGTDSSFPYTVIETYTHVDNGSIRYKVKAFDAAENSATSTDVVIAVNITPPTQQQGDRLDVATQHEYDVALNDAPVGTKRLAIAYALVEAMKPDHRLYIYQNGNLVVPIDYIGDCTVTDDGYDVYVEPSVTIESSNPLVAADLTVGTWWFELQGGDSYSRIITGSVGLIGSGAELELAANPTPGQGVTSAPKFVIPRSIDNL